MGPWHNLTERSKTHRRPPTDYDAEHCLLRTVKCVSGSVDLSMTCDPVFDYGRIEADWELRRATATAQVVATGEGDRRHAAPHHRPAASASRAAALNARTRMVEGDNALRGPVLVAPLPPPTHLRRRRASAM